MNLTQACVRKPVFAWMLMLAVVTFGAMAAGRIGVSEYPDVDAPVVSVLLNWEGASAEAVEHDLIDPVEDVLAQIGDVRNVTSRSLRGSGSIALEFDVARDIDLAVRDVESKLSEVRGRLPSDIDSPVVTKTNPEDQPLLFLGLSGPYSSQSLSDTARYVIKEKVQTTPGVGEITSFGVPERNVRIWVDANRLNEHNLTIDELRTALRREHVDETGGVLHTGGREINLRLLGEALQLDELKDLVIRREGHDVLRLRDVALVEDGFSDVHRTAWRDGTPAQFLAIKKLRGFNSIDVAHGARAAVDSLRASLPPEMTLEVIYDGTSFIERSVSDLKWELCLSALLAAAVCWIFLGSISSATNVVLAIPMSLLGTVAVLYFLGFTLNTFTLLALTLSIGLVVDDAIIILENIARHVEAGKGGVRAALEGTAEIRGAALAATLAVVAIFTPVAFMSGVIGKYFLQFGVALSIAVLLSYLEAITLAPARCARMLRKAEPKHSRFARVRIRALDAITRVYGKLLDRCTTYPVWVLLAVGVFVGASAWVGWSLPKEMIPASDQSQLRVLLRGVTGVDLAEMEHLSQSAEAMLHTHPEVKSVLRIVGGASSSEALMFVSLTEPRTRALKHTDLAAILRRELNSIPGIQAIVRDPSLSSLAGGGGPPIDFSIVGPKLEELLRLSDSVTATLRERGLVTDLDRDYQVGTPEVVVVPDRALIANQGSAVAEIMATIEGLFAGKRIGKFSVDGRRVDVRVKLLAQQRNNPNDLGALQIRSRDGALVPLSNLVQVQERPTVNTIAHRNRERAIRHTGNVGSELSQASVLREIIKLGGEMPFGYRIVADGQSAESTEAADSLTFALLLGAGVAFMILASQFNSIHHAITVLTVLPPAVAGAVWSLWITGHSLNMFSMIGFLLLMGLAKKNSILLVDCATGLRAQGLDAVAAMQDAGRARLRPILMTSVATAIAAVPTALSFGEGAETRAPMAIAVLGGITVSTVLSLFTVPAFYAAFDRWTERARALATYAATRRVATGVERGGSSAKPSQHLDA